MALVLARDSRSRSTRAGDRYEVEAMIPVLSAAGMRDADAKAVALRGSQALIREAGTAVGFEAKKMLGGCYSKRIAVIVGPGLNGADGRVAAAWLNDRGARVDVIDVSRQPGELVGYDLVVDAGFGLGCSRAYDAPRVMGSTKVLAVDLVSGVDADTGVVFGAPFHADVTLAIGALKYAHITGDAANLMGELRFASLDIVGSSEDGLVEDSDLAGFIKGDREDHKWTHAVSALCGSSLMPGAAELVSRGAIAGGASMVRLSSRGDVAARVQLPPEIVHERGEFVDPRVKSIVAGPGLGEGAVPWLIERLSGVRVPVVLDADGLSLEVLERKGDAEWIVTPHEGEFERLTRQPAPADRVQAVRSLAKSLGCVVLLKGPITLVCNERGALRAINSGTSALATAGSGDVLAGLIAGAISRGHDAMSAGALSAHLHGRAGQLLAPYAGSSGLFAPLRDLLRSIGANRC